MRIGSTPVPLAARKGLPLSGSASLPGDKSVSHRALMLGALAIGETRVKGLLKSDDVLRTADAMRAFGALVRDDGDVCHINGVGVGGLSEPSSDLYFGNSGTGCRLAMGMVATASITARFTGDASLSRRPIRRVLEPLSLFGAEWSGSSDHLPVMLKGTGDPLPVEYELTVPSAQVKSAMLLAALNAPGRTTIFERTPTRDHSERMLHAFGADIHIERAQNGDAIGVTGNAELKPVNLSIPGDPSAAAFPMVAALLVAESDIVLEGVMLNPRRTGLIETLKEMGAAIEIANKRDDGIEPVGDLWIRSCELKGIEVPPERAPAMIDEYPVLAVAAAFAHGRTVMRGVRELRAKESDRIAAIAAGLRACGVAVEEFDDGLAVIGTRDVLGGATISAHMDHRIAMAFLVLGLASREPVRIDDASMIATSFPDFVSFMRNFGADIGASA